MKLFSKIKPLYLWCFSAIVFLIFIGIMSYWYPTTADEYRRWQVPLSWKMIKDVYLYVGPRISFIFSPPIFYLGKWFFVLLNPLVQLANCLCIFYILFLRLPNVKDIKDMPYFFIISCMSIFFVTRPSEILFWISGTYNYSWMILFFLLLLCFLRQMYEQKFILKETFFIKICFLILGFFVGMSNEALAPAALGFVVCFALFCEYKRIELPRSLSYIIFGLAIGCLVFFSAPAHYFKMTTAGFSAVSSIPLSKKLFFHIYHIDTILKSLFYFPVFTLIFLLICILDKKKINFKEGSVILSLLFLVFGGILSTFLVLTPAPVRAYYSASVMFIISFLFFVKYVVSTYKFNFLNLFCYLIFGISLFLTPRFVLPHYFLHLQENERYSVLKQNPNSEIAPYIILKGPTENLTISLLDWANNIQVGENQSIVIDSEPINW